MEYISAQDAAERWGITKRRVQILCSTNRIPNAVRIGNMWVIPNTAQKPLDSRFKDKPKQVNIQTDNPIRAARNKIKRVTTHGMCSLFNQGYSNEDAKKAIISVFSAKLFQYYFAQGGANHSAINESRIQQYILNLTHSEPTVFEALTEIEQEISNFIEEHPYCCDDAMSWCYQYANKLVNESNYSSTQFFTEKYMITALVDSIDIPSRRKIFDPACGGGNFLLHCLDILAEDTLALVKDKDACIVLMQKNLDKLYGYEIDPLLSIVASINLKLKCISILIANGISIDVEDFNHFVPNIYFSHNQTIAGSLDIGKHSRVVTKVGDTNRVKMDMIFANVDTILTNPPFQTVKGMPEDLKSYLKAEYPLSRCDMCNAFIEMSKNILIYDGVAGLVTQNSWMYLDSFEDLRKELLTSCQLESICELGSNAFYDLNGEKSNVALLYFTRRIPDATHTVKLTSLKTLELSQKESFLTTLQHENSYSQKLLQLGIFENVESRFDMISSNRLRELLWTTDRYEKFAVPMQGTSTGASKQLIDYFWNHIGDNDWIPVSKGGGYSRWQGLNHYCVKWGKNGEYIKAQKGSAIRNASYFDQTEMVFSDTGTSGLNVRELLEGQIFVASGPGIRIKQGNVLAHLAFLNSRISSYYIRLLSPKLTIAAGYIAKIPVCEELLASDFLIQCGAKCLEAKKHRLSKRPFNMEFNRTILLDSMSLQEQAFNWFIQDIQDEWIQLQNEQLIDEHICSILKISNDDLLVLDEYIGYKLVFKQKGKELIDADILESFLKNALDYNCNISRTKTEKKSLGCDGLLEYLSQKTRVSCESIRNYIMKNQFYPTTIKKHYEDLLLHAIVMSKLGYDRTIVSMSLSDLIQQSNIEAFMDVSDFRKWVCDNFNIVHAEGFLKSPIFLYDAASDKFVGVKEEKTIE